MSSNKDLGDLEIENTNLDEILMDSLLRTKNMFLKNHNQPVKT